MIIWCLSRQHFNRDEPSINLFKGANANPSSSGLLAFLNDYGFTQLHNAGIFEMNSIILPMGIYMASLYGNCPCYGRGKINTFRLIAFTSYGFFGSRLKV